MTSPFIQVHIKNGMREFGAPQFDRCVNWCGMCAVGCRPCSSWKQGRMSDDSNPCMLPFLNMLTVQSLVAMTLIHTACSKTYIRASTNTPKIAISSYP